MRIIKNLFHINLNVSNWDKMIDFYCNKLGFEQMFVLYKIDADNQFGIPYTPGDESYPWITYLRVAPEEYLEFMSDALGEREVHREPMSSPFSHFALTVNNLEDACKSLAKVGVPLSLFPGETPVDPEHFECLHGQCGCKILWMVDPDGNAIEVMEQDGNTLCERFERDNPVEQEGEI